MTKPLLMVVDDDHEMLSLVEEVGKLVGYKVEALNSAAQFQVAWAENPPSVIVMDIVMPDMDGYELLIWLAERKCCTPIILISGYDGKYLDLAERLGAAYGRSIIGMLTKPFEVEELENLLKEAITPPE